MNGPGVTAAGFRPRRAHGKYVSAYVRVRGGFAE